MATDVQNWTKAYNKKNPKATDAARKAALAKWQRARGQSSGAATGTNPGNSLPTGWGMTRTPDILGSWAAKPNLDPTDYEIEQGQDKKYYARKRTELTGLESYQKEALKKWDSDSTNRGTLLTGAEQQAVNAASTIGNAASGRMSDLAGIIQSAPQSQGLGGVSTGSGVTQQTGSADQRAAALSAGAGAQLAATQMATSAAEQAKSVPTLAAYSMASLANKARSDDSATRQKLLSAFRASNAEAAAAKDEAIAQTYTDQARLLAAAIQSGGRITAEQLSQMGQNFRTTQTNETSLANNAADNATSTANNDATAGAQANRDAAKRRDDFVNNISYRIDGQLTTGVNADGKPTESLKGGTDMPMAVINDAISQKIPLGPVLAKVASSNRGKVIRKPRIAMQILQKMLAAGIPRATAVLTIQRNLGVNLSPGGGVVAGPPSPGR